MELIRKDTKSFELINFSIRTKLLLIYLLCVLVPIIVFSTAFYASLMQNTKKEKLILFHQALDRIGAAIESNAISAIELSNIIYPDELMYRYLNKEYESPKESMDDYKEYMKDAWNKILPYNTKIGFFSVYSNNDTLLNSIHIQRIDARVYESDWYGKYQESNERAFFIHHIDQLFAVTAKAKLVSFIRSLDYMHSHTYKHFLKITFQEDMFDKILKSEAIPGNIYIVDQENIIIAQSKKEGTEYSSTEFLSFDTVKVDTKQIVISKQMKAIEGWQVICILNKDFMQKDFQTSRIQIFLLIFFVTVFASMIIWMIAASLYKRIELLVVHMGKVEGGEYTPISEEKKGNDEIGMLITSMNKMIGTIKMLIEDVYKAKLKQTQVELLKKQAELNALQCQVNPHFMFNVLETIRMKAYLKNEIETARIIKYMSRIFRKLLLWDRDLIELQEEIGFIKEYLAIQQYRYDDELEFEIFVEESLLTLMIPKMTLQTFVDNACEHGFSDVKALKKIKVDIRLIDDQVELRVYDNGKGMREELISNIINHDSKGIGIKNVIGRLDVYYKGQYDFKIKSEPEAFTEIILKLDVEILRGCDYV